MQVIFIPLKKNNLKCLLILIFFYVNFALSDTNNFVNLYSARQSVLMEPLIKSFENKTEIKVNIIAAKASQLINRIESEGRYTSADILLTTDVGRLIQAQKKNLFIRVDSEIINQAVPSKFKDEKNEWFGLSLRSRILVYNTNNIDKKDLAGYLDLSNKKWKRRIMVRSSNNVYNQSLVAAMILNYGEKKVEKFLKEFVENFSRKPSGGDRDQIKALVAGEGDIALVNSYYYLKMISNDHKNIFKNTAIHFPKDDTMKTHVNLSGAGIIKYSKNYRNSVKFLEFMLSDEAQEIYSDINFEYPINRNLKVSKKMQPFLIPEQDNLSLSDIGKVNGKAIILMDKAGWK